MENSSDLDILRRIAERGLNLSSEKQDMYVDLFQHMLDEISRVKQLATVGGDTVIRMSLDILDLLKQRDELLAAIEGVIAWDKRRGFPIPYKVRDPAHAAIASVKGGAE